MRRTHVRSTCHVIWLKMMTIVKIISNIIALNLSIVCLVFKKDIMTNVNLNNVRVYNDQFIYNLIYLSLSFIDAITCIVLLRKLTYYQALVRLNPGGLKYLISGTEVIKWILLVLLILYFFLSA